MASDEVFRQPDKHKIQELIGGAIEEDTVFIILIFQYNTITKRLQFNYNLVTKILSPFTVAFFQLLCYNILKHFKICES